MRSLVNCWMLVCLAANVIAFLFAIHGRKIVLQPARSADGDLPRPIPHAIYAGQSPRATLPLVPHPIRKGGNLVVAAYGSRATSSPIVRR